MVLALYENRVLATVPLIPKSAMAKEGIMASIQNMTATSQKPVHTDCSTSISCSIKMYCITKTR